MLIRECMSTEVTWIQPDATIITAARLMRDGDFGVIPVALNDKLIGMLTDRDIVVRAVAEGRDVNTVTASECMSHNVYYCFDDQHVDEVARMMGELQIRRMPVMNRNKRLVGIVSIGDVAREDADRETTGQALGRISKPEDTASYP